MGSCLCKKKRVPTLCESEQSSAPLQQREERLRDTSDGARAEVPHLLSSYQLPSHSEANAVVTNDIKDLIKQTLQLIRSLVSNEQAPPTPLMKLNLIADKQSGWLMVVMCLVEVVPDSDPLGPAVMTLFLDESPLPTKETILKLMTRHMHLDDRSPRPSSWHRNVCIVLGCLAEKLAGSSSVQICTDITLNYLIDNLRPTNEPQVIMHAIIALEKFAQTSENRSTICRWLSQCPKHPLMALERWLDKATVRTDFMRQQVAFCAQWSLDNIFVVENRELSYVRSDLTNISAMLNHEDVSEYLKIGADGLEARCDASSFESVRCTFEATEGRWYYEAQVLTSGVMQIGFATKRSRFCNHEGYGIGDDDCSLAYDGCRQLLWYNARSERHMHPAWKAGDVLGCLIDITNRFVMFFLNGTPLPKPHYDFLSNRPNDTGYFAAASFMSFQQCRFNFGHEPFRYPPRYLDFKTFNDFGVLTNEQKTILPRRRKIELLSQAPIPEDSCKICFANPIDTVLKPCGHGCFCFNCSNQMEICPLCREAIIQRVPMSSDTDNIQSLCSNNNILSNVSTSV